MQFGFDRTFFAASATIGKQRTVLEHRGGKKRYVGSSAVRVLNTHINLLANVSFVKQTNT
jgi:hypothetical protein